MSIFDSFNVGVSGLQAQSNNLDIISGNVANATTNGYKAGTVNFADLITNSNVFDYSPGGVQSSVQQLVDVQGTINDNTTATNVAISGNGLFPVTQSSASGDSLLFTRSGSFAPDANGYLVNGAGYFLQGWPVSSTGTLPSSLTTATLAPVNVSSISEPAEPTTSETVVANLQSSQAANTAPYDPTNPSENMASGAVTPQFSIPTTIVDSKGVAHTLTTGFLKTGNNTWAVEVYATPSTDVTTTSPTPAGQVASGTVTFNGDGTLASVSSSLQSIPVNWTGGATSALAVNWGTAGAQFGTPNATVIGKANGLSQNSSAYSTTTTANGFTSGNLNSVSIDANGNVIGTFDNNTTQTFYKIPLAEFRNDDALQSESGNVYAATTDSGDPSLIQAGQVNGPVFVPSALEQSTVDVGTQLTDLIVAQNAYEANSKTITVTDTMLQDLTTMGAT